MPKKLLIFAAAILATVAARAVDELFFTTAVIPDANLFYQVDAKNVAKDTPLSKKLSKLRENIADSNPVEEVMGNRMQAYTALLSATEAFNKELEIEDDDVLRMQSSVSLKTLTLAQDKIDPASLNGLIAFEFSKPIRLEDIAKAAAKISANRGLVSEAVADTAAGIPMQKMNAVIDPATKAVVTFAFALPDPAVPTVLYAGPETSVRAALERFAAKTPTAMPEALASMKKQLPADAAAVILFSPPEAMREFLRKSAADPQMAPAFAMSAKTVAEMTGVAFHATMKEKIDLRLAFNMRTNEDAAIFKNVADGMIVATIKMMIMQKLGRTIPLTDSMACTIEGSCVAITAALTAEDIDIFTAATPPEPGPPLGVPAQ
ncbi:MAG: hypothetical protein ACOX6W_03375 [Lentisphaeria bacterium]|jgi:hypothetical protein